MKARRSRARKRGSANRAERVQATPATLAKPCPLKARLHLGAMAPHHPAGMQPDRYEAALQIWDVHDALAKDLKTGTVDMTKIANAHCGTSDGKARLMSIYLKWAQELPVVSL